MYKIREAKIEDYSSFFSLYQESVLMAEKEETNSGLDEKKYGKIIQDPSITLYVVENNGELQAFTLFYSKESTNVLMQTEKKTLYIEALFVKASEEKKGLRLYLYEKARGYAKRNGMDQIETTLPVSEQDKIAHYQERLKLEVAQVTLISDL